eukprot:377230_1
MLVTTIILTTLITIIVASWPPHPVVMDDCSIDRDCIDGNGEAGDNVNAIEECHGFGGDIGKLCYWKDEDDPDAGEDFGGESLSRICKSDYECVYNYEYFDEGSVGGKYLRCCYNDANNKGLCTATVGSGREQCGVYSEHSQDNHYASVAPCCKEEICLDDIAGLCGLKINEACRECIKWSYVLGDSITNDYDQVLEYVSKDNCGEGLKCLVNYDTPNLNMQRSTDESSGGISSSLGGEIVYNGGICMPDSEDGILSNSSCTNDNDCHGCLRCCGGQCKRNKGESCGFSSKGSCCYNDVCKDDVCNTPTATPSATPSAKPTQDPSAKPTQAPSDTIILTKP